MHATCVTRCPALGAAAPRAPGAPSSRVSSAPGSSPRVPTLLPARHLGAAAVPIRGGVLVTHARGGGTSGTAGKQARGNRGKSRPAKPTDNTKGGKQPGAVSRAKKAVKQQEWDGEMFASPGKKEKSSSGGKKSSGDDGKNSNSNNKSNSSIDDKNKHLFFDEAVVTVCGGAGGDGESWTKEVKAKIVKNFKFSRGGNTKKFIELPPAEAADGGAGGNVYIRVDRACDSLLQFHDRKQWRAKKGYHGSAAPGAGAGRQDRTRIAPKQEDLYIDVPPGTVVRRKRSGELLGDMTKHGQVLLVAEGGAGGLAARRSQSMQRRGRNTKQQKLSDDIEVSDIELDDAVVVATNGEPGEELAVELLMRVVADIGLVGLPNAGKSSILKAVTRASPEVAAYPFTTLMPNLGVVKPADVKPVDPDDPMDFSAYDTSKPENGPVLADLPGLIQGAHKGRGLGRAFLRHLRRTRAMLVVVDASGQDPVGDYKTVREELRLYNPAYVTRPHILALNKMDLEWAALRTEELVGEIKKLDSETVGDAPIAVLPVSAMEGIGMDALLTELGSLMEEEDDARVEGIKKPKRQTTGEGTNMKIRF